MRGHTKNRHNLSHYFIAFRCHLGLRIQFNRTNIEETGGIFEKIVAGVTGLEPATSCVTGRRSNQLSYTPGKGRENVAEVFSRSSGSAKKNDPDNRRQGGGCGEHRRRNVPLPGSVRHASPLGRLCQPPNLAPTKVAGPCTVSGLNQGKKQDKNGGEGGIRTPVTLSSNHAFQACAFNRSVTSPASRR